jgi:hypothetical protein
MGRGTFWQYCPTKLPGGSYFITTMCRPIKNYSIKKSANLSFLILLLILFYVNIVLTSKIYRVRCKDSLRISLAF